MMERNEESKFILMMEEMLVEDSFEVGWRLKEYFKRRKINKIAEVRAIPCETKDKLFKEFNSTLDIAVLDEMPKILKIMLNTDPKATEKWLLSNSCSVFVERKEILSVIDGKVIEERLADRLRNQRFDGPRQHDVSKNPRVRISGYRISKRDAELLYERYSDDIEKIKDKDDDYY